MFDQRLYDIDFLKQEAQLKFKENKAFVLKLKGKKKLNIDDLVHNIHTELFEAIDCLECANCCASISPIVIDKDIQRIAKGLRLKPSVFVETYMDIDEENDYVFKNSPCPFLMPDKYCAVYENRPRACREYPHTDRKRFRQILSLSLKNTFVCPAVYLLFEELKEQLKF